MWEEAMTWKLKLSNPFWTGMVENFLMSHTGQMW